MTQFAAEDVKHITPAIIQAERNRWQTDAIFLAAYKDPRHPRHQEARQSFELMNELEAHVVERDRKAALPKTTRSVDEINAAIDNLQKDPDWQRDFRTQVPPSDPRHRLHLAAKAKREALLGELAAATENAVAPRGRSIAAIEADMDAFSADAESMQLMRNPLPPSHPDFSKQQEAQGKWAGLVAERAAAGDAGEQAS